MRVGHVKRVVDDREVSQAPSTVMNPRAAPADVAARMKSHAPKSTSLCPRSLSKRWMRVPPTHVRLLVAAIPR